MRRQAFTVQPTTRTNSDAPRPFQAPSRRRLVVVEGEVDVMRHERARLNDAGTRTQRLIQHAELAITTTASQHLKRAPAINRTESRESFGLKARQHQGRLETCGLCDGTGEVHGSFCRVCKGDGEVRL